IMLAIVAGTGWFDNLRADLMLSMFEILGPGADQDFIRFFQEFVESAGGMSGFGIVGLILTAILMLNTIQRAFSRIWRVKQLRPLFVRLPIYWAVITLGPLLFAISQVASETVFATAEEAFDAQMIEEVGRWLPPTTFWSSLFGLGLTIFMLTICYMVLPNRQVMWK
ncbi:MAG: YhjD/YihY/BrkB family envelope integrity protein, partial [Pseudomonadota bacterium]